MVLLWGHRVYNCCGVSWLFRKSNAGWRGEDCTGAVTACAAAGRPQATSPCRRLPSDSGQITQLLSSLVHACVKWGQ